MAKDGENLVLQNVSFLSTSQLAYQEQHRRPHNRENLKPHLK